MICKKCGNEINVGDEACKNCGEKINPDSFKKKTFSVKIPQKELTKENLDKVSLKETQVSSPEEKKEEVKEEKEKVKADEKAESKEQKETKKSEVKVRLPVKEVKDSDKQAEPEKYIPAEINNEKPEEKIVADDDSDEEKAEKAKHKAALAKQRKQNAANEKEEKKIKRSYVAVKVICCVCAVLTVALAGVNIFTDYLKTNSTATKTVALSRLSESDKTAFEEYIIKFSPMYGKNYDFSQMGIYDFIELLEPAKANGLYASYYKKANIITNKVDPAVRFAVSQNSCRYCKVKADEVKAIASSLGIKLINTANNSKCYYYSDDGYYYFAAEKDKAKDSAVKVKVSDSKRTESGSYYIECEAENAACDKFYCLANMKKNNGETSWQLLKISDKAMFAEDGTQIIEKTEGFIPYDMRYTKITAKTSSGVVFAKYEISYPVFDEVNGSEAENKTARTINLLYSDMIKAYRDKANEADKNYAEYEKKGYVKSLLPGVVNIVSTVEYNKNGYVSLLDEMSEYSPTEISKAAKKVVRDAEKEGIKKNIKKEVIIPKFATLTYSGYTLNVETSDFVKKDEVFGKDYRPFQEKLLKIYNSASDSSDKDDIGREIYSSTWVLSENGVGFCYQNPLGYNEFIVLPYKYLDKKF